MIGGWVGRRRDSIYVIGTYAIVLVLVIGVSESHLALIICSLATTQVLSLRSSYRRSTSIGVVLIARRFASFHAS